MRESYRSTVFSMFLLGLGCNAYGAPDNCKDSGGTGVWWIITDSKINWILVPDSQFGKVFVSAGKSSCSGIFYFERTDKELLSALLAAKSTGSPEQINFYSDQGSPDINFNGAIATNQLGGIQF